MQLRPLHPEMIACGILPGGGGGNAAAAPTTSTKRRSVLQFKRSSPSMAAKPSISREPVPPTPPGSPTSALRAKSFEDDGGAPYLPPQHLCLSASQPQLQRAASYVQSMAPPRKQTGGGLCRTRSVYALGGQQILAAAAAAAVAAVAASEDEQSVSSTLPSAASSIASSSEPPSSSSSSEFLVPISGTGDASDDAEADIDAYDDRGCDAHSFGQSCQDFSADLSRATQEDPSGVPHFDTPHFRRVMEPHVARARIQREKKRRNSLLATTCHDSSGRRSYSRSHSAMSDNEHSYRSISSSIGVPYTCLRGERPFLFDEHTYPLHEALADCIGVDDLSMLHDDVVHDKARLLGPLLDRECRHNFHAHYDSFVTSFCIPLLHSMALQKGMFHASPTSSNSCSDRITYRYQAFPTIRVVRPGETGSAPRCDTAAGHSIGSLRFHVPLTPSFGTNALYAESHPGREDWHPLQAKSVGLGYLFDGARCISFAPSNGTDRTRVSLDFRVLIYRERASSTPTSHMVSRHYGSSSSLSSFGPRRDSDYNIALSPSALDNDYDDLSTLADADGGLCTPEVLDDEYSRGESGNMGGSSYYDEAYVELGVGGGGGGYTGGAFGAFPGPAVVRKNGGRLADPDRRVGFPFSASEEE